MDNHEDRANFHDMSQSTQEDWQIIMRHNIPFSQNGGQRILDHLRLLDGDFGGFAVDRLTHSLQTATRAHRDGRDEDYVVMALLLGAFVIHGLQPGPLMMSQNPQIFWGIVASMYVGNIMLLVLNMPLIGMWVQVLKAPYKILFPLILMFCIVGVFASGNAVFDVFVMIGTGVLGGMITGTVLAVFFVPVFFVVVRRLFPGKPAAAPASDVETAHD